jgi:hypothetical protein
MNGPAAEVFGRRTVDQLSIGDERSFRHVALYSDLKEVLRRAGYPFRVLPTTSTAAADRALLLNLTFWSADSGGDVLADDRIEADVVAHVAWHHLAARALSRAPGKSPSVDALFLSESIASAFDVYLVGRLLGHAPESSFLRTQVPAMADATLSAGLSEPEFERLLERIASDPDRAFAELRELLYDAAAALFLCRGPEEAYGALEALRGRAYAPLLHRYELSNWILYARAFGVVEVDEQARAVDSALRGKGPPLDWLTNQWVLPAISGDCASGR